MKAKIIFSLLLLCLGSSLVAQDDYYEDEPMDNYDAYEEKPEMPMTKDMPNQLPQVIPPEEINQDYQNDYPEEKYPEEKYPDEKYPVNEDYGNTEESY